MFIPSASNPMGTDGFEFVEYAAPEPEKLGALFAQLGFRAVARHRHKNVTLWRQGGINFLINAEPDRLVDRTAHEVDRRTAIEQRDKRRVAQIRKTGHGAFVSRADDDVGV